MSITFERNELSPAAIWELAASLREMVSPNDPRIDQLAEWMAADSGFTLPEHFHRPVDEFAIQLANGANSLIAAGKATFNGTSLILTKTGRAAVGMSPDN